MLSATRTVVARAGARAFHSSRVTRGGGGGDYDYLHAKYMYTLRDKPYSKPRAFLMVFGVFTTGVSIPLIAVDYNQRKAGLK